MSLEFTVEESNLIASCKAGRAETMETLQGIISGEIGVEPGFEDMRDMIVAVAQASLEKLEQMSATEFDAFPFSLAAEE